MSASRYDKPQLALGRLIPYDHFRTVESFKMGKCGSEVRAMLGLKAPFMKTLSFALPWDGIIYAYVRRTAEFDEFCRRGGLDPVGVTVYLNDWDDRFNLLVESRDGKRDVSCFIDTGEMRSLLERCCRIPEHRNPREDIKKKK